MKIGRIINENRQTVLVSAAADGQLFRANGNPLTGTITPTNELVKPKRWLCPIEPKVIICIGLNYREHVKESTSSSNLPEYPVVFMKNLSAAAGHNETIRLPAVCDDEVDYEGELAVVISRPCCNVSKEDALDFVLGYTVGNDVSARIWQKTKGGSQWCRGKGFDGFAPMGPLLTTSDEITDPNRLKIRTELNGKIVQQSSTDHMIFDVPTLIHFLSQDTTLLGGTVIMTGTPSGIGWARKPKLMLQKGDTVSVEIENLGQLTNKIG